jgi:hypothetical protein
MSTRQVGQYTAFISIIWTSLPAPTSLARPPKAGPSHFRHLPTRLLFGSPEMRTASACSR